MSFTKGLLLFFVMVLSLEIWARDYVKSDHYDGKNFRNLENNHHNTLWDVLQWKMKGDALAWPEHVPNKTYQLVTLGENQKAAVTFINHATFLIQFEGLNILTDPIFAQRASPVKFAGPKRVREPGINFEELPKIDVVLISHNHYDHLDLETLERLEGKFHPIFLVPLGDHKLLKDANAQNVKEMDWWEEFKIRDLSIFFTPTQHWSARGIFDRDKSLWGSFMLVAPDTRIYFGGDSGYANHFKMIKEKYGKPHLALLPIGAYEPRYFMKYHHMNPEESVKAHQDLEATRSLGMHFGTFQLSDEGIDHPQKHLEEAKLKLGVKSHEFTVLDHGESFILN